MSESFIQFLCSGKLFAIPVKFLNKIIYLGKACEGSDCSSSMITRSSCSNNLRTLSVFPDSRRVIKSWYRNLCCRYILDRIIRQHVMWTPCGLLLIAFSFLTCFSASVMKRIQKGWIRVSLMPVVYCLVKEYTVLFLKAWSPAPVKCDRLISINFYSLRQSNYHQFT
jgi:hypothetical protein